MRASRIRAALEEGAGVVTSRGDVRYVVTEYGVADLWGKSVRERALALVEIAHPDFRAELLEQAKARRYVFAEQRLPRAVYPWTEERTERLPGGEALLVRPVRLSDEETLQRLFYELSDESSYNRFMAHRSVHPRRDMRELVDADYDQTMGLVACELEHGDIIGDLSNFSFTQFKMIQCISGVLHHLDEFFPIDGGDSCSAGDDARIVSEGNGRVVILVLNRFPVFVFQI